MWWARQAEGFRFWLALERADGGLALGLESNDFEATVVAPDDSASTVVGVSESAQKPGIYTGLVPSAFLITHGVGNYAVAIEVDGGVAGNEVTGVVSRVLKVNAADFDSLSSAVSVSSAHLAVSYDDDADLLDLQVWAERNRVKVAPTAMQVDMYDPTGALVLSITQAVAVLAGNVYHVIDRPIVLEPLTTYRVEVSVTDATGTILQTRSVVTTA